MAFPSLFAVCPLSLIIVTAVIPHRTWTRLPRSGPRPLIPAPLGRDMHTRTRTQHALHRLTRNPDFILPLSVSPRRVLQHARRDKFTAVVGFIDPPTHPQPRATGGCRKAPLRARGSVRTLAPYCTIPPPINPPHPPPNPDSKGAATDRQSQNRPRLLLIIYPPPHPSIPNDHIYAYSAPPTLLTQHPPFPHPQKTQPANSQELLHQHVLDRLEGHEDDALPRHHAA